MAEASGMKRIPILLMLVLTACAPSQQAIFPSQGVYTVLVPNVKVRKDANFSSSVVGYLKEGQQINATCYQNNIGSDPVAGWCVVTTKTGIISSLLQQTSALSGWVWGGCLGMGSDCK